MKIGFTPVIKMNLSRVRAELAMRQMTDTLSFKGEEETKTALKKLITIK